MPFPSVPTLYWQPLRRNAWLGFLLAAVYLLLRLTADPDGPGGYGLDIGEGLLFYSLVWAFPLLNFCLLWRKHPRLPAEARVYGWLSAGSLLGVGGLWWYLLSALATMAD